MAMVLLVARLGAAPGADVVATAPKPSPLADAVQRGDASAVHALLKKKIDVNAPQADGATALHWAAYRSDAESTAALIRAGANINLTNNYGVTPLALAAQQGNPAVLDLLLKAGANPNDPVNFVNAGETPLMTAARSANVDAVKALARAGADVNAKETWSGQTALMWAAAEGDSAMVSTLLELGADLRARSNAGTTPFLFAVRKGDMRTVQAMIAGGADVNEKRSGDFATPLLIAIINGHEDLVDLLLDKGADPNAEGGSTNLTVTGSRAQEIPITLKTPSFREQLRDVGTEGGNGRNNSWGRPLQAAVHVANWHVSDDLIIVNIDRMRIIKSLLAHGADVNGRNTDMEPRWEGARYRRRLVGATALLYAAKSADVEVMRLLLANGADPKNQYGREHHALDGGGRHRMGVEPGQGERSRRARSRQAAGGRAGARCELRRRHRRDSHARRRLPRREQRGAVPVRSRREARCDRQERPNAARNRQRRGIRQFVRRATAHGRAAAQARRQRNSVPRLVPQLDS